MLACTWTPILLLLKDSYSNHLLPPLPLIVPPTLLRSLFSATNFLFSYLILVFYISLSPHPIQAATWKNLTKEHQNAQYTCTVNLFFHSLDFPRLYDKGKLKLSALWELSFYYSPMFCVGVFWKRFLLFTAWGELSVVRFEVAVAAITEIQNIRRLKKNKEQGKKARYQNIIILWKWDLTGMFSKERSLFIYSASEYHVLPPDEHKAIHENERLNKF